MFKIKIIKQSDNMHSLKNRVNFNADDDFF